jgi:hypothetical protein
VVALALPGLAPGCSRRKADGRDINMSVTYYIAALYNAKQAIILPKTSFTLSLYIFAYYLRIRNTISSIVRIVYLL